MSSGADSAADRARIAAALRELLRARAPALGDAAPSGEDAPLGRDGWGLDSIAVVEVLLDCERKFGAPFDPEVLAARPLTLGRLVDHVARAPRAARTG